MGFPLDASCKFLLHETCLLQVEVGNRGEVNWVGIVIVVWCGSQIHEELDDSLQPSWSIVHCIKVPS